MKFLDCRRSLTNSAIENQDVPTKSLAHIPTPRERTLLFKIHELQKSLYFVVRKTTFQRFVREIGHSIKPGIRFKPNAMEEIQEAAEAYRHKNFELA